MLTIVRCSSDGNQYFFNSKTNESRWEHPLDDYYRKLYAQHKEQHSTDRFPAYVTFPVADKESEALAALIDPVGPRERVKNWVATQGTESGGNTRRLRQYTTSASDSTLARSALQARSAPDDDDDENSLTDPAAVGSHAAMADKPGGSTRPAFQWRGSKMGSWAPGDRGDIGASSEFLAVQLERMQLAASTPATSASDAARCSRLESLQRAGACSPGEPEPEPQVDAPSVSLSEAFGFPGASGILSHGEPRIQY